MSKAGVSPSVVLAKIGASPCTFDTSAAALSDLTQAGVPAAVLASMVTAHCTPGPSRIASLLPPVASPDRDAVKKLAASQCPKCPLVAVVGFAADGTPLLGGTTKSQRDLIAAMQTAIKNGRTPLYMLTSDWEDASYLIIWWAGAHSYSYTYLFPQTTITRANVSGSVDGSPVSLYGNSSTTTYRPRQGVRTQEVVNLRIYAAGSGNLLMTTSHVGNFRWSRPDKDCMDDAFKWLRGKLGGQ